MRITAQIHWSFSTDRAYGPTSSFPDYFSIQPSIDYQNWMEEEVGHNVRVTKGHTCQFVRRNCTICGAEKKIS